jgi:hypothetical protein
VESIPAVTVMASTHHIKLRRVTEIGATFIEYTTDFSSDAGLDVTQVIPFFILILHHVLIILLQCIS